MARNFVGCREKVFNRGRPPVAFLNELVDWGVSAPAEIFTRNNRTDIYSVVSDELGPWANDLERRAAMLEVLRVLAGFESSWKWNAGPDTNNPDSNTACTEEAGILQCSGDSMNFDGSLKQLLRTVSGRTDCISFQRTTKTEHKFALEYCARLLRFTVAHHGPVRDHHIQPELRRDAMAELLGFLQGEMDVVAREGTLTSMADIRARARAIGSRASGPAKPKSKAKTKAKARTKAKSKKKTKARGTVNRTTRRTLRKARP
jgi:hypothetical protein